MTEWQKKKIEWYRSDKKWKDNGRGRRVLENGDVAVLDPKGNIKEVFPKDGSFYGRED